MMKKYNNKGDGKMRISIRLHLMLFGLFYLILPSFIVGIIGYFSADTSLTNLGKVILENSVEMTIEYIEDLDKQVQQGKMSMAEAQELAKKYILGEKDGEGKRPINPLINLGEHGHMFFMNQNGTLLAHPVIEGQSVWNEQGEDGNYFAQDMVEKALNGGGFTYYDWYLPNTDKIAPKITYTRVDPKWGWVVAAGTYLIDFNKEANKILLYLSITLGISMIIGAIAIYLYSLRIARPILQMVESTKQVAAGDLTVREINIKSNNEIGELSNNFNIMISALKGLVMKANEHSQQMAAMSEELTASTEQTSQATEEITASIQELTSGSERQVADTKRTVEVVNDITKGMEHIAKSVQQVDGATKQAAETAKKGNNVVDNAVSSMSFIQESVDRSVKVVNALGEKSNEIGHIISLITNIANQTNLLALNAAIEAARAGEQGRGFAVVADEVRNLAEESSHAAGQIEQLIVEIQQGMDEAIRVMYDGTKVVEEGLSNVDQAGHAFRNIFTEVEAIARQMQEVSSSVQQIYAGAENLETYVAGVAQVSRNAFENTENVVAAAEEQSASMEEITAAANTLSGMAEELLKLLQSFKI